jgi:ATP-dependent Lon protease
VLPVGGIKEKILAAKRAGIKEIILSQANRKDISEIKKSYLGNIRINFVKNADEVIRIALLREKVKHPRKFNLEPKPVAQAE